MGRIARILIRIFFLMVLGCESFQALAQTSTSNPQVACGVEKKAEANQVIHQFGVYKIQGLEGVLLHVCRTSGGLLTYQFQFPDGSKLFGVDDHSHDQAVGPERDASQIDVSKPWGLLYGDDDLWVYGEKGGCFYWYRSGKGGFTCKEMPFEGPTDKDSYAYFSFHGQFKKIQEALSGPEDSSWEDKKGEFRPYSQDFPQIIQSTDYPTIEAIEFLYDLLRKVGSDERTTVVSSKGSLQFGHGKQGVVGITGGEVSLDGKVFKEKEVRTLFSTLKKILDTVSVSSPCHEVQFSQFGTRAYATRTVIEIGCLPHVILLESDSNGPHDDERLYVLDLVKQDDEGLLMDFKK